MKIFAKWIVIILALSFMSCVTQSYSTNNSRDYYLSKGEKLKTFIETQDQVHRFSKHNIIPTDNLYKTMLNSFDELDFIYNILYDSYYQSWLIALIGRSTTLYLEYTSNYNYAQNNWLLPDNKIPYVNSWMNLNNVPSLDNSIRNHLVWELNNGTGGLILEVDGEPYK